MEKTETIVAYKGFGTDMACRGFTFEFGKTYTHNGVVSLCKSGFHAVEFPLDAFSYYPPTTSVYADVSLGGVIDQREKDSKRVGSTITINAKMSLMDFIKAHVKIVVEKSAGNTATGDSGHAAATGDYGHAAATGDYGNAAVTGYCGHAAATGDSGHAAVTGYCGHAAATGYCGHAAATGYCGHAAATGDYGHAAATGNSGHAAATGDYGYAAATGDSGHAAATGDSGHAAATGYCGHAAATGYCGHAAATGNYGHAAATGNSGHAAATGNSGHAAAIGDYGCAFAGFSGRAKASVTGSFVIAWRDGKRARLVVGVPGENGIKPDVFYCVNNRGELEERA